MTTTSDSATTASARQRAPERVRLSPRADAVTLALSFWLIIGLFVDGWAHNNLLELETFFTPWHALFYSGFTACAAWIGWQVIRAQESGRRGLAAVPVGYELGVAGIVLFALGGVGDFTWHQVLGIEQDIDILFSPTHLVLMTAMALIITSPLRSALAAPGGREVPRLRAFLPPLLSITLLTALVSLFFMYFSIFTDLYSPVATEEGFGSFGEFGEEYFIVNGIATALVSNLILVTPVLFLLKRWQPPFGAVTVLFTVVALMANALTAFATVITLVPAVVGGLGADLAIRLLRPSPNQPWRFRLAGLLLPLPLFTAYYATLAVTQGALVWEPEIVPGLVVYNALAGLLLAQVMLPQPQPQPSVPAAG